MHFFVDLFIFIYFLIHFFVYLYTYVFIYYFGSIPELLMKPDLLASQVSFSLVCTNPGFQVP